jgi:acetyl-CoA carboxylase carboxyltransferase component
MPFEAMLRELEEKRAKALSMGGPEKLAKRASEGLLNARERLDCLLDEGTFAEMGLHAVSARPEMRHKTPADGKVMGFGKIDGREAGVVSNDFTVVGASSALTNSKKLRYMKHVTAKRGIPLVFLGESAGARMPDRMGSSGRAISGGSDGAEFLRLRKSPWVSALLGPCYGSSAWYACASDFVVMRKGATMSVASSRVTSMAIGQETDAETLGGSKMLSELSGLVDMVVNTDQEALAAVRRFLSYLPGHCNEAPPVQPVPAGSDEAARKVLELFPEARTAVYDMRKIVACLADRDSVFELKARYGRTAMTALARLGGRSVGIVANNPMYKGGALDADACSKVTDFLVLCDSFNIPIIFLVDVPGFLIGLEGEKRGLAAKIINWMHALPLITVPKITVIVRKSYGKAYPNMGGGLNSDVVACWPTADLGFMDPKVGVNVLHGLKEQDDPERFRELAANIARDSSGWALAELFEAQDLIDPRDTRSWLVRMLDIHGMRLERGVGAHLLANWPTTM